MLQSRALEGSKCLSRVRAQIKPNDLLHSSYKIIFHHLQCYNSDLYRHKMITGNTLVLSFSFVYNPGDLRILEVSLLFVVIRLFYADVRFESCPSPFKQGEVL